MKTYALLPARGGSKRIPRKNIKIFNGKPLIHWTLMNLIRYEMFDEIIVSTDDQETADLCKAFNIRVLGNRPANLSDDLTSILPVITYVLNNDLNPVDSKDHVVCIYPSAVLLEKSDLTKAKELFMKIKDRFIIAATEYSHPIQRSFRIDQDKSLILSDPKFSQHRTQDLESYYHDAGQFVWGDKKLWNSSNSILVNSAAIAIPNSRIQDIDTPEDWKIAEIMHRTGLAYLHTKKSENN
jgi:pseudaminic acid cytidylyltransferase